MLVMLVRVGSPECSNESFLKALTYFDQRLGAVGKLPLKIRFAGTRYATQWACWGVPLYGFAARLTLHEVRVEKDGPCIVLSDLKGNLPRRKIENVVAVYGIGLDDDAVMGRDAICAALGQRAVLTVVYNTFSDGKPGANGAEDRTRVIVTFARPLEGELLRRLIELGGYQRLCLAIEAQLGLHGTDQSCMEPARCHYLPAYPPNGPREAWLEVFGSELIDGVPMAEAIVAELEAEHATRAERRARRAVMCEGNVPRILARSLKGVLLASLIDDLYGDLVHRAKSNLIELRRCPFAAEHSSGDTHAGECIVYDPDADAGNCFPRVWCHHQTCKGRRVEEFVAKMIAEGDLDAADVFLEPLYRELYF